MKRRIAFLAVTSLAAIALCDAGSVYALYVVFNTGTWPESWPKELEPLRKQSRTFEGPVRAHQHYAIPFTKRAEFESAWPHILKVKSKGSGVRLVRAPNFFLGGHANAGVVVHSPPLGQEGTTYLELVVDGDIVDLNRIPLPADTPIIDERFKVGKNKSVLEQAEGIAVATSRSHSRDQPPAPEPGTIRQRRHGDALRG
jgi:hypothetical protein